MDCIVDFSASLYEIDFTEKSIEASLKIIEKISDRDVLMEFVLVRVYLVQQI